MFNHRPGHVCGGDTRQQLYDRGEQGRNVGQMGVRRASWRERGGGGAGIGGRGGGRAMAAAAVLSLSFAVVAVAGKRRRPLSMPLAASGAGAAAANEVMATTASSRQRAATAAATVSRGAISPVPSPLVTCRRFSGARSRRRRQAERRAPPLPPTFPLFSAHSPGCCLPPLNAPTRVLSCSERRRPPRRPLRRHFFLCIARRAPLRGGRPRHPISRPSPPPTFSLPLRVWQPPV